MCPQNNIIMKHFFTLSILLLLAGIPAPIQAQNQQLAQTIIEIEPLFQYPTAPEELEGIQAKSAWLMQHFWDSFDFKNKNTVDQTALNHAFKIYSVPMRWAPKDEVIASNMRLLKVLEKNPTLLLQFTKAAEENLYGPRAEAWIDEVYLLYLQAITSNKKIADIRKTKYVDQLKTLKASAIGSTAPRFTFTDMYGNEGQYFPMSTFTIIEFGDPDCDDCRMSRLKMEASAPLSNLVSQGKVNILFIVPDADDSWTTAVSDYPRQWTVAASEDAGDVYDLRNIPSFYVIDTDGKILLKNITVQQAIEAATERFAKP